MYFISYVCLNSCVCVCVCVCVRVCAHVRVRVQLQRLKRSLSFKTIMRSKSVENFFQRSNSDARLPPDFITEAPSPPPYSPAPPQRPASPVAHDRSPSLSPSLSPNPSLCSHSPSLSPSLSSVARAPGPQITHSFQEHVFRKPTSCQHCKQMIVGKASYQAMPAPGSFSLFCPSAALSAQISHRRFWFSVSFFVLS